MSDVTNPLPSRRAQREAREAAERAQTGFGYPGSAASSPTSATTGELPSRRALRQSVPAVDASESAVPAEWTPSTVTVGTSGIAVTTLHVENFPTGEIAGPIDSTGEIILTGPIEIHDFPAERITNSPIDASAESHQPGIPRRATEALSIIGRAAPIDEKRRIPSVGQGISAGIAAFLGLLVVALIVVAIVTQLI